jgi:hypothetical protein
VSGSIPDAVSMDPCVQKELNMAIPKKMSQVRGITYTQAAAAARRTPFGGQLSEDAAAVLLGKAQRQAARTDMTVGEKAARRLQLRMQTGVTK